jgi:orotate phosphoribosyltransferase
MCRSAKAIFVEREDGRFRLRRGFTIPPGARVLMVEDFITTGLSSRETLEALAEHPGTIVGAACFINRSGGKAEIGVGAWRWPRSTSRPIRRTRCRRSSRRFRR